MISVCPFCYEIGGRHKEECDVTNSFPRFGEAMLRCIKDLKKLTSTNELKTGVRGMKFWEAVKAMQEGEKVCREDWVDHRYWYIDGVTQLAHIKDQDDNLVNVTQNNFNMDTWEIYKEKNKITFHECLVEWADGTESLEYLTEKTIQIMVSGDRAITVTKTGKTKTVEVDK